MKDLWKAEWKTLHDMFQSKEWQGYESDRLGNDLFINDPKRADRIQAAAEDGSDGSTHAEHIEDWKAFTKLFSDDGGDYLEDQEAFYALAHVAAEIELCCAYHAAAGTLFKEVG